MATPKIVVLGAGYAGLMTVVGLQKKLNYNEAEVTLVNQNDYHYITTLLHEPAAGTQPADHARIAIRDIINENKVKFIQDRVTSIKLDQKEVHLAENEPLSYDYLVIGLGSAPETFGIRGLMENAMFIRNINSVRMINQHIEYMFSKYHNEGQRQDLITIVVGGAGFTGIEFVGELIDRMPELCRKYDIPREKVRLINIEAAPTVLPGFDPELVDYAVKYFESNGVEFRLSTPIEECTDDGVILKGGEEIKAATVVWTGGVRGNKLVEESGLETMRGRVKVDEYLRAPGHPEVFVLGDSSLVFNKENDRPYPPTAQIATQQGQNCAKNLVAAIRGGQMEPFVFDLKGTVASLGRKEAIGIVGKSKLFGLKAVIMKRIIELRWLFLLGGISMVLRKGRHLI